jgi:hypothetical protein
MFDLCPKVNWSGIQMASEWYPSEYVQDKLVRFSNGQLAWPIYCGLKTSPVFEWLTTRWPILPFENQTIIVSGI